MKMDDVSIEFSVVESSAAAESVGTTTSRTQKTLQDGFSDCLSCFPLSLPFSSTLGSSIQQRNICGQEAQMNDNSFASRIFDEESHHLAKKISTNETDSESSSDISITQADPFAHREGKTLSWRNVNMVVVRL